MGRPPRNPKYQDDVASLRENLPFREHEWLVQRVGWALMTCIVLAGFFGAFGDGPLARETLTNASARLEYERLARREYNTRWRIIPAATARGGAVHVAIDAQLVSRYRVTEIVPQPEKTRFDGGEVTYEFSAAQVAAQPIVFHVETRDVGMHRGSIRVADGPPFAFAQFIYP